MKLAFLQINRTKLIQNKYVKKLKSILNIREKREPFSFADILINALVAPHFFNFSSQVNSCALHKKENKIIWTL